MPRPCPPPRPNQPVTALSCLLRFSPQSPASGNRTEFRLSSPMVHHRKRLRPQPLQQVKDKHKAQAKRNSMELTKICLPFFLSVVCRPCSVCGRVLVFDSKHCRDDESNWSPFHFDPNAFYSKHDPGSGSKRSAFLFATNALHSKHDPRNDGGL